MRTSEFSFRLSPSKYGIGVFAIEDIGVNVELHLFSDDDDGIERDIQDIPKELLGFCIWIDKTKVIAPKDFTKMSVGWYLNHSDIPNVYMSNDGNHFYALHEIKKGEELFINYNTFNEPYEFREAYYYKGGETR